MEVIAILFFCLLGFFFIAFIIREQIENYKFKKNSIQVYESRNKIKVIDKKDYYKYEEKDKEIRQEIKKYNDWFNDLDKHRSNIYLLERSGLFYDLGFRGTYFSDYIKGKIDRNEFEAKYNDELESEEFSQRKMKEITDYEEIKMERIKIKNEINKKSKELSELYDKYSDLETIIRVKDKGRSE